MYSPHYENFVVFLSSRQYGFVRHKSTITNKLAFHQAIYKALDKNRHCDVVAFWTDFSRTLDKISHYLLLCKAANLGVSDCWFKLLHDYLSNQKQVVRVDNVSSRPTDVTSSNPQGSLQESLLLSIIINELLEALAFSDSYFFADDLKFLSVNIAELQVQTDFQSFAFCVKKTQMALRIKLGLFNSLVFPILLYGIQCIYLSKRYMIILLQKKSV